LQRRILTTEKSGSGLILSENQTVEGISRLFVVQRNRMAIKYPGDSLCGCQQLGSILITFSG
jgi:hypothetical protein